MSQSFDINVLLEKARGRWLKPSEVYCILLNHEKLQITHEPPNKPASGSLFLYNRRVNRSFRRDGYAWRRKKDGRTVGEAHERLKVGNVDALSCYYAHGEQNPCFQRRCFWMLEGAYDHIVLVQYLEVAEGLYYSSLSSVGSSPNDIYGNHGSTSDFSEGSESRQSCVTEVSSYSANKEYYHDSGTLLSIPELEQSTIIGKPELGQTSLERSEFCMTDSNDSTNKSGLDQALKSITKQLSLGDDDYIYLNQARSLDFVTNIEAADRQGNQTSNSLGDNKANQIRAEGTQNGVVRGIPPSWENVLQFSSGLPASSTYQGDVMEAPVCVLVDAMFRLPGKLDALLVRHGYMLPRGAADEISLIKQDLEKMVAILQEHDESGAQDHAMLVKCLTKEVRELSYDMEDSVDQYEHATGTRRWTLSARSRKYKITRHRGKTAWRLPEKLKWRMWIANKIREFSVRSQEVLQRYSLFNHLGGNGISSSTASTSTRCVPFFGSWHRTLYGEPVGINDPLKKLEAWLDKDGEQKLKVVSVVGPGGVGKTTLANELYRRLGGQFECRAFVRTSRKPDVRRLLISMLSQVRPHWTPYTWKVHSLIADIRTHLQDKRYLIVIDDIWDTQTWDIINRALPDGNRCSGILITTEVEDVALKCCGYDSKYVFTMIPLGHEDSRKLFFNTAFGPKYECPSKHSEVANSIIRKCAGLPLATVIVANTLVGQMGKPEQWDYVNKSLGYGLRTNLNSEGMKQVLNLSYRSLPEHLKACVMYLSIYEEDCIIQKDDMVKQWSAEGFIPATEEKDKEEISRSYFDELIRSRMIQPVHLNDNDDVLSCSVHYMVLDFVTQKSIEDNFVTAIDHCQTTARLADKVRRLSLHFGNAEATSPTNMRLSQVRTLAYFGGFKCLPYIAEFGLLQVLTLHLWSDEESISFDLSRISKLFRLRYLHVTCNATLEVPQTQMRGLQYLETLKIDARVSAVPSDIVHLPGLLHLSLLAETNLPNGIGHLTSLWTLGYFDLSVNSIRNVQSLGKLTNLRDLRLTFSAVRFCYPKRKMDNMGSVLAKLSNLRSLTLEPSTILDVEPSSMSISCDSLSIISSPPAFLQRFEWLPRICTFSSLPKWIGHLEKLCILKIGICKLVSNDVDVLRGLPALTVLSLFVRTKPAKRIVFSKTGFPVLKYFKFTCSVPWLEFEVDTMPNLLRFKLGFDAHGADQHDTRPLGIENLSGLKEISAKIGGGGADDPDRTAAESALSYATKMHPAHPAFNIQRVDRMFPGKNEYNSGLQEEEHMTPQKQIEFMEEDSIEQHQVLQKDFREDAHSRKMLPKWSTQVRLSSLQDIEEHDDGFSWLKYGQKDILGSKYPRGYYRCKHQNTQGCQAMKHLQRTDGDLLLFDAMYVGNHTCTQGANSLSRLGHKQISVSVGVKAEGIAQGLKHMPPRMPKLNTIRRMQVRVGSMQDIRPLDDGFSWRKYGEKDKVLGSKYPRGYFKCVQRGCTARKHVQRTDIDPLLFDVVYNMEHTCAQSVQEQSSDSVRVNRATTSESQVTYEEVSGSVAGVPFRSPAMSGGEEEASGNTSKVRFTSPAASNSQVTYEAASGSGSTTGSRLLSPVMSESQVTYEGISGSTAVYAEEICSNPVREDFHIGPHAPPISPKSPN